MLRRLADDEKPLQLCLRWSDDGGADSLSRRQFLLQDNVTSDIAVRLLVTTLQWRSQDLDVGWKALRGMVSGGVSSPCQRHSRPPEIFLILCENEVFWCILALF